MNGMKRENIFLIIWSMCLFLLVGVCNIGFLRGTWSAFGNMTGQLTAAYIVEYASNYPSELGITKEYKREASASPNYVIKGEQFVLDGYEFIGWNTSLDGLGKQYLAGDSIILEENITLYAQWKKIEVVTIFYGDVNLNGMIDEEDYLLIENAINDGVLLEGQALLNADCNIDGKVDLMDADIIKQAFLGTDGYSGSLPNEPILKYEIYNDLDGSEDNNGDKPLDGDVNEPTEDNNLENDNSEDDNVSGSTENSNDSSGSGNSSAGGSNNKPSNGGNNSNNSRPNSNNDSTSGGGNQEDSSLNEKEDEEIEITDKEEDKNLEDTTNNDSDNKNNMVVNKNDNNKLYVWVIVVLMCFISFRLILYVIDRFKKNENNNDDDE